MVGLYSWYSTMVPLLFCKSDKKIISVRGMLHPGALGQKSLKKKIFLKLFRSMGLHKKVAFHATDYHELDYIHDNLGNNTRVFVAGNYPIFFGHQPIVPKVPGKLRLVSIALISPMKNILRVLSSLKNITGEVEYNIYGAVKDEDYLALCKETAKALPQNIRVTFHGALHPDSVKEVLARHHVFILPSESENFGHSIYEALSAGRPAITSLNTPYKELPNHRAGINVLPSDENALSDSIRFFVDMNEEEYAQWSTAASAFAESFIDIEKLGEQYGKMFLSEE